MMHQIPFAFQWIIPENQLLPLKDTINEYLESSTVDIVHDANYSIIITVPSEHPGQMWIFLCLELGNLKKIKVNYTVIVQSANLCEKEECILEKTDGWGSKYCTTEEFFDPKKKYIVDGKFIVKIHGIFEFEDPEFLATIEQQIWDGGKLGDELWSKNDGKDFTIVVDGKEIKVHKLVLRNRSTVFAATFDSKKEATLEIIEYSSKVVETAIKLLYDCNFITSLSLDDKMSLLQFFDKYNVPSLKEKIEPLLIKQVSAATVVRLTNCSIFTNSKKLESKCMEFLMNSFAAKTPLADITLLDRDVALKILQNSLYHVAIQSE